MTSPPMPAYMSPRLVVCEDCRIQWETVAGNAKRCPRCGLERARRLARERAKRKKEMK